MKTCAEKFPVRSVKVRDIRNIGNILKNKIVATIGCKDLVFQPRKFNCV